MQAKYLYTVLKKRFLISVNFIKCQRANAKLRAGEEGESKDRKKEGWGEKGKQRLTMLCHSGGPWWVYCFWNLLCGRGYYGTMSHTFRRSLSDSTACLPRWNGEVPPSKGRTAILQKLDLPFLDPLSTLHQDNIRQTARTVPFRSLYLPQPQRQHPI